jgi:hypothetical protein
MGLIWVDVCAAQSNFRNDRLQELKRARPLVRCSLFLWESWPAKAATSSLILCHPGENSILI